MKYVSYIDEPTDLVTKEYVDNITGSFVKTFTESFETSDYIETSTNMWRENGYIRANRQYQVEQNVFSAATAETANTSNVTYDAGRIKIASTSLDGIGLYTSNFHAGLTSANTIYMSSDFNHVTADTFSTETAVSLPSGIQADCMFYKQVVDISNNVWHIYQVRSTGHVYAWVTNLAGTSTVVGHTQIGSGAGAVATAPATTIYRTLQAFSSNYGVVVTYWSGGSTTNTRLRTIRLSVGAGNNIQYGNTSGNWVSTPTLIDDYQPTTNVTISCVDLFVDVSTARIHIAFQTSSSTIGSQHRIITVSGVEVSTSTIWADPGAKQISIGFNETPGQRELAFFHFDTVGSNAIRARRWSLQTNSWVAALVSINVSTNGMGQVVSTGVNGQYLVVYVKGDGVTQAIARCERLFSNPLTDFAEVSTSTAYGPYGATSYKDSSIFLDGDTIYALFPAGPDVNNRYYELTRISRLSPYNVTSRRIIPQELVAQHEWFAAFVKKGSTIQVTYSKFTSTAGTAAVPYVTTLGSNSSKLLIEVRNRTSGWIKVYQNLGQSSDVNLLSDEGLSSPIPISLGTTDTQIQTRFTLFTPNSNNQSPLINNYKIFVNETNTNATTGNFVSSTLIDDRLITKAILSADVNTAGLSGTVSWRMSNNGGTTWVNVTPGVETNFNGLIGNNLKVEGTIAIGSSIANANSVQIRSYSVVTTNLVFQTDLITLQVNMLKLGLQITTLQTQNRFDYKNMMIDLFETNAGIEAIGSTLMPSGGIVVGTGVLLSKVENTDVNEVSNIIVCAETNPGGTVTYDVSRDNGVTWEENISLNTITPLTKGTVKNRLRIRANLTGATLLGWAYLYN